MLVRTEIYSHIYVHKIHVISFLMFWVISWTNMWPGVHTQVLGTETKIHLSLTSNVRCVPELQAREGDSLKACSLVDVQHLDSCSGSRMTGPQLNHTPNPAATWGWGGAL